MAAFTFSKPDLLNSTLTPTPPHPGSLSYTTTTKDGFLGRKTTVLAPAAPGGAAHGYLPPVRGGEINWRKECFEIGGVKRKWGDIRRRKGGLFSGTKEWEWAGRKYTVKYADKQWMVTEGSSPDVPPTAALVPHRVHLTRAADPAAITFFSDLSHEDMVFLILVLVYSETKRKEKKEEGVGIGIEGGVSAVFAAAGSG